MKIGVYGLGRFGVFWGSQLSKIGAVYGYSRNRKNNLPDSILQVGYEKLLDCDVIVLCVAISAMEDVLKKLSTDIKKNCLVMDTCSVKVHPVYLMDKYLPAHVSIIGTHPMFGPDSGKNGIRGLPLVLSPVRNSMEVFKEWRTRFIGMGTRVIEMTADEHDREAAFTQGITHFIGRVLKELELKQSSIGTLGYTKLLEIIEQTCNDPEQLFFDLQRYNPYTNEMRGRLFEAVTSRMSMISDNQA